MVRRKPGASPLLFGEHLMQLCAFVFLEDISSELPPYEERLVNIQMDGGMLAAYRELEDDIRKALKEHRGNRSVLSQMLNTLLVYPDHPFGLGTLYGTEFDPEMGKVRFVIAETKDLPEHFIYAKERRLIEEIKKELEEGRRCQVFAGLRWLARIPNSTSSWKSSGNSFGVVSSTAYDSPLANSLWTAIWFWVRVPVLSTQSTVADPRASMAVGARVRTFLREIRRAPSATNTVSTTGNSSGRSDIAIVIPTRSPLSQFPRVSPYTTATSPQTESPKLAMILTTRPTSRFS
jgi:hypothetical protein